MNSRQLSLTEAKDFLLALAKTRGSELEVYSKQKRSFATRTHNGAPDEMSSSTLQGVGIRVLKGGAWGQASSENLSIDALIRCFEAALENAGLVAPSTGAVLGAWADPPVLNDLHGEGFSGIETGEKIAKATLLETTAKQTDPRIRNLAPYGGYSETEERIEVANTAGLDRAYTHHWASVEVSPLAEEHGKSKQGWGHQISREFDTLDAEKVARQAAQDAISQLGAVPAPTGQFETVLEARAVATLLAQFSGLFNAQNVQDGKSVLRGKLGSRVGNGQVVLVDDATLVKGPDSRPFDAEGYPSRRLELVAGGVLQSLLHNTETAAKDGVQSTGHAWRFGPQGMLWIAPSNFFFAPGPRGRDEIIGGVTDGVLVASLAGNSSAFDHTTGNFSGEAHGFKIQNGKVTDALEVFALAGNFLKFLEDILDVGNDLSFPNGWTGGSTLRVRSLSVGGAGAKV